MAGNVIEVVVRAKDETAEGTRSAQKHAEGLRSTLAETAGTAAGFLAAGAIGAGVSAFRGMLSGAVESASNLNESLNAVQVVFGKSATEIINWGKTNAQSFGLSQKAFNELATPLGAMLKNTGMSMQDTTKWTVDLTKRAADMASVFNTSVPEAMEAVQAGLRGESDPLEKYGVGLSAAKVEAEALAETHKKSAKQLTATETATARLNLIMKQTSSTQGDFKNTSGGLANAQRIQAARLENLQAAMGQKMLPVQLALTEAQAAMTDAIVTKVIPAIQLVSKWIGDHKEIVAAVAVGIMAALVPAFIAWAVAAGTAAGATIAAAAPLIAIGAIVAAIAAALIFAYKHCNIFASVVKVSASSAGGMFTWLGEKIGQVINWISEHWGRIGRILIWPVGFAVEYIIAHWDKIKSSCASALNGVVKFFTSLPGRITGAVGNLKNLLVGVGGDVISGLWSGMTAIWDKVTGWISGLGGWIKDHKGPLDLDKRLLIPAGHALMNGLWDGLKAGAGPIGSWLTQFTGGIGATAQGGVGAGVERWRAVALQALSMTGSPASWVDSLLRRMQQESGGNQYAINNSDINAQRGDPSRGLMQTIGSTFRAYAGGLAGRGIYDPLANIVASIRYANAAYGSAPRGWNRPGGYDRGGWLLPGTTLATNLTGKPEAILTQDQLANIGGGGRVVLEINSGGSRIDDMLLEILRKAVRVRGGNVQVVMGQ